MKLRSNEAQRRTGFNAEGTEVGHRGRGDLFSDSTGLLNDFAGRWFLHLKSGGKSAALQEKLLCVVEDDAQRVPGAAVDAAYAVAQVYAVIAARTFHRPVARRKNDRLPAIRKHHLRFGLRPRPLLDQVPFPAIRRGKLDTLQVNVGYRCNQSCFHCHVNAGPNRTEEMSAQVADLVLDFVKRRRIATLDITGGAPELNPHFRELVERARALIRVAAPAFRAELERASGWLL